jgi:MATE family multidrug resistance protein
MGLSILIEVSGFALMAVFIARLGTTAVAGHQIAANLVSVLFMMPMALASATSTLVAQRVGARDLLDARRLARHGIVFGTGGGGTAGQRGVPGREGVVRLYTQDAAVIAAALPILAWVTLFHVVDAAQTLASFVLRAYRIATLPMFIFAGLAVGRGAGRRLRAGLRRRRHHAAPLRGAPGYWAASTAGLTLAAVLLLALVWKVMREQKALTRAASA